MSDKKNEFSDLAKNLDRKFKEIDERKKKVSERIKKVEKSEPQEEIPDSRQIKFKEQKDLDNFRVKEKLTYGLIVFCLGHVLLLPLYLKYPQYALNMFLFASISLAWIAAAVIDYG